MSLHASEVPSTTGLDAVLRRAGAVFASRNGNSVAVNFGSSAGELAACLTGAGLADCSELIKLEVTGSPETLTAVSVGLTGVAPAPGGAVSAGAAWWCGAPAPRWDADPAAPDHGPMPEPTLGRLIVLCEPAAGRGLPTRLQGIAAQWPALRLHDRSSEWSALAVVGRRAAQMLDRLGVYGPGGDPRRTSPFTSHPVAGIPAQWLLQSDHRAVVLVDRHQADRAWHAIESAGRALGVCCIGHDALARHALLERRHALRPLI